MGISQQEQQEIFSNSTKEYFNENAIEIRLKQTELIRNFELLLRGQTIVSRMDDNQQVVQEIYKFGEPKANEAGIQSIIAFVSNCINTATVMGNFTEDYFNAYIYDVETSMIKMLVRNRIKWNMDISECGNIHNSFTFLVIPFMTRLIGDGERKHLSPTIKTTENTTINPGKQGGGFSLFGGSSKSRS